MYVWSVSSCETFMKIESYRRCNTGFRVYPPLYMTWLVAKPRRNWESAYEKKVQGMMA